METHSQDLSPEAIAKSARDLKKVQQRTAALIIFAVVYQCTFALIGTGKYLHDEGRTSDASVLVVIGFIIALLQTSAIRVILGHKVFSPLWTVLALAPAVAFTLWLF